MDNTAAILFLLESILGKGKQTSRGNHAFFCPKCGHKKRKLEINLDNTSENYQRYHCWTCVDLKGAKLKTLFTKLNLHESQIDELSKLVKSTKSSIKPTTYNTLILPKEFQSLITNKDSVVAKQALKYLENRGITQEDIIKYNLGYCSEGQHASNIIIPSYDERGQLNYFIGRSFDKNSFKKYSNPDVSKDVIFFEYYINWNVPIILCEGAFDAMSIKRNVIPLLGKTISNALMKKLVTSKVSKIYLALDNDAIKSSLHHAEKLMNLGKEVYLVELTGKDPNVLGFEAFTNIIQNTNPLTLKDLLYKKIETI